MSSSSSQNLDASLQRAQSRQTTLTSALDGSVAFKAVSTEALKATVRVGTVSVSSARICTTFALVHVYNHQTNKKLSYRRDSARCGCRIPQRKSII